MGIADVTLRLNRQLYVSCNRGLNAAFCTSIQSVLIFPSSVLRVRPITSTDFSTWCNETRIVICHKSIYPQLI